MNVPVFLMLAQVQRQSYRSSYSDSYSSAKTRPAEEKVFHQRPTESQSYDISPRHKQMALNQEAASRAAMLRKIREAGL